jgi:hypothetical protein
MSKNKKRVVKQQRGKLTLFAGIGVTLMAVCSYLYVAVLPYYFSPQRHIPLANKTGEYLSWDQVGEFHGDRVYSPPRFGMEPVGVLGSQDPAVQKRIEVDLTNQKLYAVENGKRVAEFAVSTGKWGWTPTGTFRIWTKLTATTMSGGSKALGTYYYLPNVPYTMFFYNEEILKSRGYGIHGAYWHSNFGEVMSHGCINMRTRDVEKLFYWAEPNNGEKRVVEATGENPGTEIVIYGEAKQG